MPEENKTENVTTIITQLSFPLEDSGASIKLEICPECGIESVAVVSKCKTCMTCGWSLCSA